MRLNGTDVLEDKWPQGLAAGAATSGLMATNDGVLIAAGAPILDGFSRGPARGMVTSRRFFVVTDN